MALTEWMPFVGARSARVTSSPKDLGGNADHVVDLSICHNTRSDVQLDVGCHHDPLPHGSLGRRDYGFLSGRPRLKHRRRRDLPRSRGQLLHRLALKARADLGKAKALLLEPLHQQQALEVLAAVAGHRAEPTRGWEQSLGDVVAHRPRADARALCELGELEARRSHSICYLDSRH